MFPDMFLRDRRGRWHGGGLGGVPSPSSSLAVSAHPFALRTQGTGLAGVSPGSHSQSEEVGEPLEDAGTQAADAVVGEVPAR